MPYPKGVGNHSALDRPSALVFPSIIRVCTKLDLHAELNFKSHMQGGPMFLAVNIAIINLQRIDIIVHRLHILPMISALGICQESLH